MSYGSTAASAQFIIITVVALSVFSFTRCFEHVTLIPVYLLTRQRGLYDLLWALLRPYAVYSRPLSIFILTEFMRAIPRELEGVARINGSGPMHTFFRAILPLSTPG